MVAGESHPPLRHRAIFLADSFEGRGWSSRATTPDNHDALREDLWSAITSCGETEVGVEQVVSDRGDVWWLRYRSDLDRQQGRGDGVLVMLGPAQLGDLNFWWPDPDTRPDAPQYYGPLGFSRDLVPDELTQADPDDSDLLARLGIRSSALTHFRPRIALSRLPPSSSGLLDAGWEVLREFPAEDGRWTIGLLRRDPDACTALSPQSPGQL